MEGWVELGDRVNTKLVYPPADSPSTNPAAHGQELNSQPVDHKSDALNYPGGMEGWVDLGDWLHTEMVYTSADSPSTNPAVHGRESNSQVATCRSQVQYPNYYTTKPSGKVKSKNVK